MFAFSFLFHSFSVACLLVGIYITEPNAGVGGGPAVTRIRHLYVKKKKKIHIRRKTLSSIPEQGSWKKEYPSWRH